MFVPEDGGGLPCAASCPPGGRWASGAAAARDGGALTCRRSRAQLHRARKHARLVRRGLRLAAGGVCPPGLQREAPQVLQETVEPNVEQVVEGPEVHILQEQEVIAHVPVVIQQKQQAQRIVEVLVPMAREEIVHVPKIVQQVRQHYIPVEGIDDVHVDFTNVVKANPITPSVPAIDAAIGRLIASVPEATTMNVYNFVKSIVDPKVPAYLMSMVNEADAKAAYAALIDFNNVVKANPITPSTPASVAQEEVAYITYAECQRIGQMLAKHLASEEEAGEEVREEDLIIWYMEQVEEEIQTEAQLFEQQHLVQFVINRLVDDCVIVVCRPAEDPMWPEGRVLVKHPNFPVGEDLTAEELRGP